MSKRCTISSIFQTRLVTAVAFVLAFMLSICNAEIHAQEANLEWPKQILAEDYIITLYVPENTSYVDLRLDTNIAFSVKKGIDGTPVFGMMWTTSLLDVDRSTRTASLVSVKVNEVKFPDGVSKENEDKFKSLIEEEVPKWNIEFPLEDLLDSIEEVSTSEAELGTVAPKIIFSTRPAVLVFIDGDPKFKAADKDYEIIQNSASFIALELKSNKYYLSGGTFWYEADTALGPWKNIKNPPSKLQKLANKATSESEDDSEEKYNGIAPEILVTTVPSELILTDGDPNYSPLQNTNLLYVVNSEDDLFMNIANQAYYILISGRWFTATNVDGPWNFINAEELPEDFKKIGKDSEKSDVLTSVAGTKEAQEAIYDAQIPQTAEISRNTAASKVVYNGDPEFQKIQGLSLEYALNTESAVFKDKDTYFLCDNAIWFKANSADGPWIVATDRPEEVSKIPPENPQYNTKYVYIYETTPSVVYVGYTPGYHGSYVYGNTVVYGTGYYYNPWYRGFYYHHKYTYGFSVRYNPWYGWSFGFSFGSPYSWWGNGYWGRYNHWGPPFYRPPYYRPGYRPRPSRPIYRPNRPGVRPYQRPVQKPGRPNLRPDNRPNTRPVNRPPSPSTRPTTRPSTQRPSTRPSVPVTRPTNPSTRPTMRPTIPRPSTRPSIPSRPSVTRPGMRPQTRPSTPMSRPAPRPTRPMARPVARPSSPKARRSN